MTDGLRPVWPAADPVADRAAATPDRTAIVDADADRTLSYREYDRLVATVADALASHGADRVGYLLAPRPEVGALVFAAMRTGTTLVPLSLREPAPALQERIDRTVVELVVCSESTADQATALAVDVVSVDPLDEPVPALAALDQADSQGERAREIDWVSTTDGRASTDEPLLIGFTSGTSGEPKGVTLTAENVIESATASAFRLGVDPEDRWLCCLPTYHVGGIAPLIRSAVYGTTAVIQRSFEPDATAEVLADREITGVSLVPTMLRRLLDAGWSAPDSLRFVLLGGAPASESLLDRSLAAGIPVCPTYGLTETASQVATARPSDVADHPGTVGQPLARTRVTVVDRSGDQVDPGEQGEIVVAGPTVTPGYLDPDRTEAAFGEYGLHTGDVGYRDENGRLWVTGRLSDTIVSGGENVDPATVESALESHPAIETVAVVGVPDEEWGERVGALLVPAGTDGVPTLAEIREYCDGRLARYKHPRTVATVDELPRTASGTVDRDAVRERLGDSAGEH